MSTQRTEDRLPIVNFSIEQSDDRDQVELAQRLGQPEPTARLQRRIYQAGLAALKTEVRDEAIA